MKNKSKFFIILQPILFYYFVKMMSSLKSILLSVFVFFVEERLLVLNINVFNIDFIDVNVMFKKKNGIELYCHID